MRAMISRRGAAILVLVLALALVAVACGGSGDQASTASSAAATAASGASADQIVKDSEAKMATVNSASFAADFALKVQGDTAKMTDPTAKALLSQGITLHAEGASANDPTAVDMTMSLGIAGQNLEFGMMSEGKKSWLEYQGTWYALDAKNSKALDKQAQTGAAPTEQLKSMGVDPSTLGHRVRARGHRDAGRQRQQGRGLPRQGRRRPAEAGGVPDQGRRGPEPRPEARRLGQRARAAQPGPHAEQAAGRGARARASRTPPWTTGSASTTSSCTRRSSRASMDTSGQKDMQGVTGMTMKGSRDHGRLRPAGRRSRRRPTRSRSRSS